MRVFSSAGLADARAELLARILATNSLEGVPSHGMHFLGFILEGLRADRIQAGATPSRTSAFGAWEQWDGNQGPGPLNALQMTERAMELAAAHGVGCVALRNTNHWTRPGYYGHLAARRGFALICWGNTPFVMPPWGSKRARIGNNPIVFALPNGDAPLVMDMALSQFSIGRLQTSRLNGEELPVPGGHDDHGELTRDPAAILRSGRSLAIGHWKGTGMALLLDLLAATLASGNTTLDRSADAKLDSVSQIFVAFDLADRLDEHEMRSTVARVLEDLRENWDGPGEFHAPGEGAARHRAENLEAGVPVDPAVWQWICDESNQ